jgi:hypothetical protein
MSPTANRERELRDRLTRVLVDELSADAATQLASEWSALITADVRRARALRRRLSASQDTCHV